MHYERVCIFLTCRDKLSPVHSLHVNAILATAAIFYISQRPSRSFWGWLGFRVVRGGKAIAHGKKIRKK